MGWGDKGWQHLAGDPPQKPSTKALGVGYEERCGFRCAHPASPSVSCKAWPDVAEPSTMLLETLPAATSPHPPLPKGPFEHLSRGHLLGVVVVAIEDLPKERLVHGQLTGLAAVPRLGARL